MELGPDLSFLPAEETARVEAHERVGFWLVLSLGHRQDQRRRMEAAGLGADEVAQNTHIRYCEVLESDDPNLRKEGTSDTSR